MYLTVANLIGVVVKKAVPNVGKKLPRGHIFRGKNRLVKQVTPYDVMKLKRDYAIEEKNMFYLRHPYLTVEQSHGHVQHLKKHENWLNKWNSVRDTKFTKTKTLESELCHLKCSTDWDFKAGSS